MTYDFNIPSGTVAAPDTLFTHDPRDPGAKDLTWNTVGTVAWYLLNGVPANKIVVGVPFYGQPVPADRVGEPRAVHGVRLDRTRPEQPDRRPPPSSRATTRWSTRRGT